MSLTEKQAEEISELVIKISNQISIDADAVLISEVKMSKQRDAFYIQEEE